MEQLPRLSKAASATIGRSRHPRFFLRPYLGKDAGLRRRLPLAACAGVLGLAVTTGMAPLPAAQAAPEPSARVSVTPSPRVAALISQMTLDEKLSFVSAKVDPKHLGQAGYIPGVPRLGIPELRLADGPAGIRANQRATALPAPIAMASTFDEKLARKYGQVMGQEGRALGQDVVLAPMTNIIRVPQAGRNFETLSEDPLLSADMVAAQIKGIQGQGLIATVKHFAENNQETNRQTVNVTVDDQTMREVELPAFQAAVDAGAGSVMCAYNKLGGTYACGNNELLNGILKAQWGFRGWVMSDWGATHKTTDLVNGLDQNMFLAGAQPSPFFEAPLKQAILDGSIPVQELDDAVARIVGQMERFGLLDGAATNRPARDAKRGAKVAQDVAESGAVLLKNTGGALPLDARDRSIALIGQTVKTPKIGGGGSSSVVPDAAASPLDTITMRAGKNTRITYASGTGTPSAIPLADSPLAPDGTLVVNPGERVDRTTTLTVPTTGEYVFTVDAPGAFATVTVDGTLVVRNSYASLNASVTLTAGTHTVNITGTALQGVPATLRYRWITPQATAAARSEAVAAAKTVQTPIVFGYDVGLEGVDRPGLSLPFSQNELIAAVADANPNTIVVLNTGSSVTMPWLGKVNAVLDMYYPGQNGAEATARLLYGDVNPSGKLTQTFPANENQTPVAGDPLRFPGVAGEQVYSEGIFVGYKWYDQQHVSPLFPFGHGLSYTSFTYRDLQVKERRGRLTATFILTNSGNRAGQEVAQIYVGPSPDVTAPQVEKKLAGFKKVYLKPGESRTVRIAVDADQLSYWDIRTDSWHLGTGTRALAVGGSSAALPLHTSVEVGLD